MKPLDTKKEVLNIEKEALRIKQAMKAMVEKAKKMGIERPEIYFEAEGWVYVVDSHHPEWVRAESYARKNAVVGKYCLAQSDVHYDVGAW